MTATPHPPPPSAAPLTATPAARSTALLTATPHPPPPAAPELPDGVRREPPWPWWFSLAGFGIAVGVTLVLGMLLGVVALLTGGEIDDTGPAMTQIGTVIQYAAFVAAAVGLARLRLRPRAWHFGFRRTRFWPALGWSALAFFCFFVLSAAYALLLNVDEEQTTLDDLGTDDSTFLLVSSAALIIVVAPVVEEFFFRGFFYRSLRTSLPTWGAALIAGGLFGLTHVFTGVAAVPPLMLFGILLCLLYEQTGSLYPPIALHAFNNTISFLVGTEAVALSLALGAVTIAGCVLVPRFTRRAAPVAA